jgi:integrase
MESIYFEQPLEVARRHSLEELVETFFRHNKVDKTDGYGIRKAFALFFEMLQKKFPNQPLPDTANFKPGYLLMFQHYLAEQGTYSKSEIERKLGFIKRVFHWCAEPQYDLFTGDKIPGIVSSVLWTEIKGIGLIDLKKCRENEERLDVPREHVEAVFLHVPQFIEDMLSLQLCTSMRPGEVCNLRVRDIKRTKADFKKYSRLFDGENWMCVLDEHKTVEHIGKKVVAINLEAQAILNKYIGSKGPDDFVFTKVTKRGRGKPFTVEEYGRYIKRAIDKNKLYKFTAYQVRHTGLSQTALDKDLDTARAVAGHTTTAMTKRYVHSDPEKVMAYAREQNELYRLRSAIGYATPSGDVPTLKIYQES